MAVTELNGPEGSPLSDYLYNAGITRRPKPLVKFDNQRVGGRVHATVRPLTSAATKRS